MGITMEKQRAILESVIKEEIDFYVNQPPYSPQEKEKSLKKEILKYRSYRNDLNKQYHSFTKVMHAC